MYQLIYLLAFNQYSYSYIQQTGNTKKLLFRRRSIDMGK